MKQGCAQISYVLAQSSEAYLSNKKTKELELGGMDGVWLAREKRVKSFLRLDIVMK